MAAFSVSSRGAGEMAERTASVERNTLETQIKVSINLDGTGKAKFDIGVPFLEHMLDQIARHGLIDLDIYCKGDLHIDNLHTVNAAGITLTQPYATARADNRSLPAYAQANVTPHIAPSRVAINFSARPPLQINLP